MIDNINKFQTECPLPVTVVGGFSFDTTECAQSGSVKMGKHGNTKHGLSGHYLNRCWRHMKSRCFNKNDHKYHIYGGRGITVCDEWISDFKAYYNYVMSLENALQPGLTIDRENNDGNYEPGNLRWASLSLQSINRNIRVDNTTGYVGVYYRNGENKWVAELWNKRKKKYIGYYGSLETAVMARNQYILDNNLPHKIQEYAETH